MPLAPPETPRNHARSGAIVAMLLLAATACSYVLDRYVSLTSQAMIYVLVVVIASYKLDWIASAMCAVGAVTALNFFFVPPRWTLEVEHREHFIALAAMLVVALVISRLATGLRRETAAAHRNAQRARQLQTLASDLSIAATAQDIKTLGQSALDSAFDGPCNLVLTPSNGLIPPDCELATGVQDGLRCCMRESAVLGPGTGRWPGLNAWYVPLGDQGHILGAVHIQPAESGNDDGREHAQALCALLAQALWRLHLTDSIQSAQNESQRQQLQSTFLAAISHDLRTPLAAVVGAASALQTQAEKLSPMEKERLLGSIVSEAKYLSTLTENTLQLVRLSSTAQGLLRDWESMEEIVGAVLARVRERDPRRRIQSKVPEGLPLVKADPVLLAQLVGNLLDNALKYSTQSIDLSVCASATELQVSVKDRGPGIPQEQHEAIFQPYARNDHSGQRGAGLGLAVCRAIAQAHSGSLTLRARAGGGSSFTLTLPVEAQPPHKELP